MHNTARIHDALHFIPPDNRDTWLRMGMAVKSELGDAGFDVWDTWSSQDDSYNPRDSKNVWKSIDSTGPVTAGTLFHIAKENGWRDYGKHPKPSATEIKKREHQASIERQIQLVRQSVWRERAAQRSIKILDDAKPAETSHPYLVKKQIHPHRARQIGTSLVNAVTNCNGDITSVQFIHADGTKLLLQDGQKKGCCIVVDGPRTPSRVLICEGWSTGCTLAEDEPGSLVLTAIDAGNLAIVARLAKAKWPDAELVIAGDDDRLVKGNPGKTKATDCAVAVGALLAFPEWPAGAPETLTDFNDLACYVAGGSDGFS